jgi:cytochrome c oxidase subunit II
MLVNHRRRWPGARTAGARATLTASLALLTAVATASCATQYPNSVFTRFTEFNRDVDYLFSILIWLGTAVFVFVEAILLYTLVRFRRRGTATEPKQVHGNTTLELLWTIIPAVVLVFIAVPTVRTIFRTQAKPRAGALEVTVIGHQWWWEFRYPQFTAAGPGGRIDTLVTANELYLPLGRTVNFSLDGSQRPNVIHSFWIPQLGGKRDWVPNHRNFMWFTPDSVDAQAWNGFCAEYCGASHANMRFRAFTVSQQDFESWARHQLSPAVFRPAPPAPAGSGAPPAPPLAGPNTPISAPASPDSARGPLGAQGPTTGSRQAAAVPAPPPGPGVAPAPAVPAGLQFIGFSRERLPSHTVPRTPLPAIAYQDNLVGDSTRGAQLFATGTGACIGCHAVRGVPTALGVIGPNLTHFGGRTTIGAGLYPNDPRYLARWIKNARAMKPGVVMPALGRGEYDPVTKQRLPAGLDDQQIADLVAYLRSLR